MLLWIDIDSNWQLANAPFPSSLIPVPHVMELSDVFENAEAPIFSRLLGKDTVSIGHPSKQLLPKQKATR